MGSPEHARSGEAILQIGGLQPRENLRIFFGTTENTWTVDNYLEIVITRE